MASIARTMLGALPGLVMGLGGLAKAQGLIGGGLTPEQQAGNNAGWANMGKGLNPDGTPNTNAGFAGNPGAPMQLPGATMRPPMQGAAQAPFPVVPFQNPAYAFRMPMNMPTRQPPGPPMSLMAQPAGLLGAPDETSQRAFLASQLGNGPVALPPLPTVAGGSSTQAANPFLYSQLYGDQRG